MKPLGAADPGVISSYRLLGVLGSGGMGRVYLGESRTGRRVAVKVIRADVADDPVFRRRFAREVKAARAVSPLYTAAVVDADASAAVPWLATTYIDGPSLTELVSAEGPLPPAAVLTLAAGLSEALASIHKVGLVHRDLKPSNVIINDAGPHIIDFGIVLTTETTRITSSILVGTPSYIAPEIIFRNESSPASDVFSLGATLVFAASGKHLVEDGTMYAQFMQITSGQFDLGPVPKELRPLIVRCISAEPKDRATADELARILVASGVPAPSPGWYRTPAPAPRVAISPPLAPRSRSGRPSQPGLSRRRVLKIGGVAGAVAVVGSGIGVTAGLLRRSAGGASAAWQPGGTPSPARSVSPVVTGSGPGTILWQARSGVTPLAAATATHPSWVRMVVDPRGYIVTADRTEVFATDIAGRRLWSNQLSPGPLKLSKWGDATLVTDSRTLWLLEPVGGTEIFAVKAVEDEIKASRNDNADGLAVEVGALALSADRAFLGLGTATIAIDRRGVVVWRVPRPSRRDGRRPPAGAPLVVQGASLLTHDASGTAVRLGLRNSGNGAQRWWVGYELAPPPVPGPGPGPGGPPSDDDAWQRSEARFGGAHVVVRDALEFRIFELSGGRPVWRSASRRPATAVEVVGDLVLVAADRVTTYDIATGAPSWQVALSGARLAPSVGGKSIIAATDQSVSAIELNGDTRWHTALPSAVGDAAVDRLTIEEDVAIVTFRARRRRVEPLDIDVVAVALDRQD